MKETSKQTIATFNWDFKISDNMELNTSLYGSAGRGGGTGLAVEITMYFLSEKI